MKEQLHQNFYIMQRIKNMTKNTTETNFILQESQQSNLNSEFENLCDLVLTNINNYIYFQIFGEDQHIINFCLTNVLKMFDNEFKDVLKISIPKLKDDKNYYGYCLVKEFDSKNQCVELNYLYTMDISTGGIQYCTLTEIPKESLQFIEPIERNLFN